MNPRTEQEQAEKAKRLMDEFKVKLEEEIVFDQEQCNDKILPQMVSEESKAREELDFKINAEQALEDEQVTAK